MHNDRENTYPDCLKPTKARLLGKQEQTSTEATKMIYRTHASKIREECKQTVFFIDYFKVKVHLHCYKFNCRIYNINKNLFACPYLQTMCIKSN